MFETKDEHLSVQEIRMANFFNDHNNCKKLQ